MSKMFQALCFSEFILSLISSSASNSPKILFSILFTNLKYLIKMSKDSKIFLSPLLMTHFLFFFFVKKRVPFFLSCPSPHLNLFYIVTLAYQNFCMQWRLRMPLTGVLILQATLKISVSDTLPLFSENSLCSVGQKIQRLILAQAFFKNGKSKNA